MLAYKQSHMTNIHKREIYPQFANALSVQTKHRNSHARLKNDQCRRCTNTINDGPWYTDFNLNQTFSFYFTSDETVATSQTDALATLVSVRDRRLPSPKMVDESDPPEDGVLATTFARSAARISSTLRSLQSGYPEVLRGKRTRFSSREVKSSTLGGGIAVMMSSSTAICLQYVSKGRSLTSWPKGFSISLPIVASPRMMYAATVQVSFCTHMRQEVEGLPIEPGIVIQCRAG